MYGNTNHQNKKKITPGFGITVSAISVPEQTLRRICHAYIYLYFCGYFLFRAKFLAMTGTILDFQRKVVENTLSCNMRYVWPRSKYLLLRVIFTQTI